MLAPPSCVGFEPAHAHVINITEVSMSVTRMMNFNMAIKRNTSTHHKTAGMTRNVNPFTTSSKSSMAMTSIGGQADTLRWVC